MTAAPNKETWATILAAKVNKADKEVNPVAAETWATKDKAVQVVAANKGNKVPAQSAAANKANKGNKVRKEELLQTVTLHLSMKANLLVLQTET